MSSIKILYLDCHGNNGFTPPSGDEDTMTVKELIDFLSNEEPDEKIYISDDGLTYKCIGESDFSNEIIEKDI